MYSQPLQKSQNVIANENRAKKNKEKALATYTDKSVWTTRDKLADPAWEKFNQKMAIALRPIDNNIRQLKSKIQESNAWLEQAKKREKKIPKNLEEMTNKFNTIVKKEQEITLTFMNSINPLTAYSSYKDRNKKNQLKKEMEDLREEYEKNSEDLRELSINIKLEERGREMYYDSGLEDAQKKRKEIIKLISRQFYDEIEPIITAHFSKQLLKWKEKSKKSKLGGKTKKKRRRTKKKRRKTRRSKKKRRKRRGTKKKRRRRR